MKNKLAIIRADFFCRPTRGFIATYFKLKIIAGYKMLARAGLVKHNDGWYVGPRLLIDDYDEFPIEHPSVRPFIESTAIFEAAGHIPEHDSYYNVIMEWGMILVFLKENQSEYHILVDMLRDRITTKNLPAGRSK